MDDTPPAQKVDLRALREAFIIHELRRVRVASYAVTSVGFLTLIFLALAARQAYPKVEWQLIALLGFSCFCVALPLFRKIDLSKDGSGFETTDPMALIGALQERTEEISGETFESLRQQIGAVSDQLTDLAAQMGGFLAERSGESGTEPAAGDGGTAHSAEVSLLEDARFSLPPPTVPDDPQKGRFGGDEASNGRILKARVEPSALGKQWMKVALRVSSTNQKPLRGRHAYFFLHDTYQPYIYRVRLSGDQMSASLEVPAYGAYTVGAIVDSGATKLELDLATSPNVRAPADWRER